MKIGIINQKGIVKSQKELFKNIINTCYYSCNSKYICFNQKSPEKVEAPIDYLNLDCDTWTDLRLHVRNYLEKEKYDKILICFNNLYKINYRKMLDRSKSNYIYSMNFVTNKLILRVLIFIEECLKFGCEVAQLYIDPQENNLQDIFYEYKEKIKKFYILNKKDIQYCPFYEYSLIKNNESKKQTKDRNFCFRATALTNDRLYLIDNKDIIESYGGKIVTNIKSESIKQSEYYDELSKSKFTLIVPSYDKSTFSIIRFLEAISLDCIPLIYNNTCLDDLKNTFPSIYSLYLKYENYLFVKHFSILHLYLTTEMYNYILSDFKNSEDYQKMTDLNYQITQFRRKIYEN